MNPWYAFTYEAILELADWKQLDAEVEKKLIGIYSWMPRTIMNLNMPGKLVMCDVHTPQDVIDAAAQSAINMCKIEDETLKSINLIDYSDDIEKVVAPLFRVLGSVAASKYFHFSRPYLFPMWDATLRNEARFANSPAGFIQYMRLFQQELLKQENFDLAIQSYPKNVVRGWDIIRMQRRKALHVIQVTSVTAT